MRQQLDKLRRQHKPIKGDKIMVTMNISRPLVEQARKAASLDDRTMTSYIAKAVKHYLECNKLQDVTVRV